LTYINNIHQELVSTQEENQELTFSGTGPEVY